jgi:transcriptional regulator with XRE-family HTH domain
MKERLQQILELYDLTPSRLAEKMGVQRSGISHIMSGRNKPSFDFMIALLKLFPELNANWLLTGEGDITSNEKLSKPVNLQQGSTPLSGDLFNSRTTQKTNNQFESINKDTPAKEEEQAVYKSKQEENDPDSIESVIILYRNGKFKRYRSE